MKEVFSRNGGTSMIKSKHKQIKFYNMNYLEESVVHRLIGATFSSFLLLIRKEILNE
jgi:hypothetical protein